VKIRECNRVFTKSRYSRLIWNEQDLLQRSIKELILNKELISER